MLISTYNLIFQQTTPALNSINNSIVNCLEKFISSKEIETIKLKKNHKLQKKLITL
jgi:hypothetical protein